jgi:UDP-N-acetylglucosamine 2-epimerase
MKIFAIVGARPQFIKLAPLSSKLKEDHEETIVHTGQHYDYVMSEKIFLDLGIRTPDIHLGVGSGSHAYQTAEIMKLLESSMIEKKPDLVIVFGDTNSTVAAALVAAKLKIKLLHIEAGLRSYNKNMPEEINRIVTDHVSEYLFAPTQTAVKNLSTEGLHDRTWLTGDIMVDTMETNLRIALQKSSILKDLNLESSDFSLLTLHRDYNVDDPIILKKLLDQLGQLDGKIIFPVHPRTNKMLSGFKNKPKNIQISEPVGYLDFITLEYASRRIITDSGGIQKEAYILKKPCITLRTETEWVETVEEKWNLLVSPMDQEIAFKISSFVPPDQQNLIFGENVADKMLKIINSLYN